MSRPDAGNAIAPFAPTGQRIPAQGANPGNRIQENRCVLKEHRIGWSGVDVRDTRAYAAFLQNAGLFFRVDSQGWHPGLVCDAPSAHGIVLRPRLRAMPWAFTGRPVGAGKVWFVSWPLPVGAGKAWFVSQPLPVGAGKARFVSRPLPVGAGKAWFLARPSPLDSRPAATHLLLAVPKPPPYKGISPTGNPRPFRAAPRPRGRHHILFP